MRGQRINETRQGRDGRTGIGRREGTEMREGKSGSWLFVRREGEVCRRVWVSADGGNTVGSVVRELLDIGVWEEGRKLWFIVNDKPPEQQIPTGEATSQDMRGCSTVAITPNRYVEKLEPFICSEASSAILGRVWLTLDYMGVHQYQRSTATNSLFVVVGRHTGLSDEPGNEKESVEVQNPNQINRLAPRIPVVVPKVIQSHTASGFDSMADSRNSSIYSPFVRAISAQKEFLSAFVANLGKFTSEPPVSALVLLPLDELRTFRRLKLSNGFGSVTILNTVDLSDMKANSTFFLNSWGCGCTRAGLRLLFRFKVRGRLGEHSDKSNLRGLPGNKQGQDMLFLLEDQTRAEVRFYLET